MNIGELRETISQVNLLSTFPFINGYGMVDEINIETGEREFVVEFYVSLKVNKDYILDQYMLPKSLSGYGLNLKTKVKEQLRASISMTKDEDEQINYYKTIVNDVALNDTEPLELMAIKSQDLSFDYLSADDIYPSYSYHPNSGQNDVIDVHYQKARPLSGGSSSIYYPGNSDATLGLIVRDKQDRSVVALSNSHVYARSLLLGEEAMANGNTNNLQPLSTRQPGSGKYGDPIPENDHIGIPKRASRLSKISAPCYVDAAITELSGVNVIDASSANVIHFKARGPYQFATTDEINSIVDWQSPNYRSPIFRSGRTLGPLGFPGSEVSGDGTPVGQSPIEIHSMTQALATAVDTTVHGISSLYMYHTGREMALYFTTADETSAFITGSPPLYSQLDRDRIGEPTNIQLAIQDANGIKIICSNSLNTVYVNKVDQLFYQGALPNHRLKNRLYIDWGLPNYREYSADFTELPDANGNPFTAPVKKMFSPVRATTGPIIVLTEDNKIFTYGSANLYYAGVGKYTSFQCSGLPGAIDINSTNLNSTNVNSLTSFNQIQGDWIDFGYGDDIFAHTSFYAISASGDIHRAFFLKPDLRFDEFELNDFSNSYETSVVKLSTEGVDADQVYWAVTDLAANRVPLIIDGDEVKVKRIFTTSYKNACMPGTHAGKAPMLFQTQDNKIAVVRRKRYQKTYTQTHKVDYLMYNSAPVIVDENNLPLFQMKGGTTDSDHVGMLSGNNYYLFGSPQKYTGGLGFIDPWWHTLGSGTNYSIDSALPVDDYFLLKKWDNYPPNNEDIVDMVGSIGWLYSSYENDANLPVNYAYTGTSIYTDGIGISAIGVNNNNAFLVTVVDYTKDEMICTDVFTRLSVNFRAPIGTLVVAECLNISAKNKNFAPVAGGDSGSALFACLSSNIPSLSTWKMIGLVYAGPPPSNGSSGFGVRIDNIQRELDIEPWNGIIE